MSDESNHDKFHTDNTNEVVDFIDKVKTGWLRWGDWLLGLMLVASASLFAYRYYSQHKDNAREEAYHDLDSDSPESLAFISKTATYTTVGPQAALRAADLFLKKSQVEGNAGKSKELLDKAETLYKQVAGNAALPLVFRANASLGLGSVAETKGEWDGAETAYKSVVTQTGDILPNLATLAQTRIALLATVKHPVIFGKEPPVAPPVIPAEDKNPPSILLPATPGTPSPLFPTTPPLPEAPKGLDAPLK